MQCAVAPAGLNKILKFFHHSVQKRSVDLGLQQVPSQRLEPEPTSTITAEPSRELMCVLPPLDASVTHSSPLLVDDTTINGATAMQVVSSTTSSGSSEPSEAVFSHTSIASSASGQPELTHPHTPAPSGKLEVVKAPTERLDMKNKGSKDGPQVLGKLKAFIVKLKAKFKLDKSDKDVAEENIRSGEDYSEGETTSDHGRCDWGAIRAVKNDTFGRILLYKTDLHLSNCLDSIKVVGVSEGTYHHVRFLEATWDDGRTEQFVIKVPAHGTRALWQPEDSYMMKREVELMQYVWRCAAVPVAQIFAHETGLDNDAGFPYILMRKLPGKSAYKIWYDQLYYSTNAWMTAACPSKETELKRANFLRSLACIMTELSTLTFDKIGTPIIDGLDDLPLIDQDPRIGSSYRFSSSSKNPQEAIERPPFSSTQEYIQAALDEDWDYKHDPEEPSTDHEFMERCGVRKILDMVFATGAFNPSKEQETFALAHHDLDLQNLLTDEDGNITGIIDWDGSIAAPRCIGTAAVPIFLNRDWFPGYANTLSISPHLAWKTETYRQFYAQALVEAGHPDAKFTTKSPIYQAALCALYLGGSAHDFTEKLLREIPGFRLPPREMKVALGMGWEDGEKWLKGELRKILEPQMPVADPVELVGP